MSNWDGSTHTWADNEIPTYTNLNTYTTTPLAAIGDAWTSDTSWGWHGAVSDPALGNGTKTGRYKILGLTTYFSLHIEMGSTTTYGSGLWSVGIPGGGSADSMTFCASAVAYDSSAADYWTGSGLITASAGAIGHIASPSGTPFANTTPFTWATGDTLTITGFFWNQ